MLFSYYSLSFCKPQEGVKDNAENRGELLMGDRIENSPYRFKMYTNETDIFFCKTNPLSKDNFELLKRRIDELIIVSYCFFISYELGWPISQHTSLTILRVCFTKTTRMTFFFWLISVGFVVLLEITDHGSLISKLLVF
ncbi:hypothetical protein KPL70_002807 [Citrus sinensis]|nr:hypothetical protein KPL70_002807 [Citrus sinensis]